MFQVYSSVSFPLKSNSHPIIHFYDFLRALSVKAQSGFVLSFFKKKKSIEQVNFYIESAKGMLSHMKLNMSLLQTHAYTHVHIQIHNNF